jgi:transketolase
MRRTFADLVYEEMQRRPEIYVLTGDLGYMMWDSIRNDFSNRFYNVGCAEQLLMGCGVGLALEGKLPIVYSITPFLLYRPFEFIRNYLHHENVNVKLAGSGRGQDYYKDGFSHWAEEDRQILSVFPNIKVFYPETTEDLKVCFCEFLNCSEPSYINLKR